MNTKALSVVFWTSLAISVVVESRDSGLFMLQLAAFCLVLKTAHTQKEIPQAPFKVVFRTSEVSATVDSEHADQELKEALKFCCSLTPLQLLNFSRLVVETRAAADSGTLITLADKKGHLR